MIAYLVLSSIPYEGDALLGAYSNAEAAEAHRAAVQRPNDTYERIEVEEWELKDTYVQ